MLKPFFKKLFDPERMERAKQVKRSVPTDSSARPRMQKVMPEKSFFGGVAERAKNKRGILT